MRVGAAKYSIWLLLSLLLSSVWCVCGCNTVCLTPFTPPLLLQVLGNSYSVQASSSSSRPAAAAVRQQQPCQLSRQRVRLAAAGDAGAAASTKSINPFTAATITATSTPQPAASSAAAPERTEEWSACMQRLQDMGFAEQQAEQCVQRAFGWGAKARSYWRHEKVGSSRICNSSMAVGITSGTCTECNMGSETWSVATLYRDTCVCGACQVWYLQLAVSLHPTADDTSMQPKCGIT